MEEMSLEEAARCVREASRFVEKHDPESPRFAADLLSAANILERAARFQRLWADN